MNMRDRIALAIWQSHIGSPLVTHRDGVPEREWAAYSALADAVLDAMREPDKEMLGAAIKWAAEAEARFEPIAIGYQRMIEAAAKQWTISREDSNEMQRLMRLAFEQAEEGQDSRTTPAGLEMISRFGEKIDRVMLRIASENAIRFDHGEMRKPGEAWPKP